MFSVPPPPPAFILFTQERTSPAANQSVINMYELILLSLFAAWLHNNVSIETLEARLSTARDKDCFLEPVFKI